MSCGLRSLRPVDRVIERSHDSQVTVLSPELIKRTVLRIVQKRRDITLDKLFTYSTKRLSSTGYGGLSGTTQTTAASLSRSRRLELQLTLVHPNHRRRAGRRFSRRFRASL